MSFYRDHEEMIEVYQEYDEELVGGLI